MERIGIGLLREGMQFEAPLHSRDGRLLLQKGRTLTRAMIHALVRSPHPSVYLGEWSEKAIQEEEAAAALDASNEMVIHAENQIEKQAEGQIERLTFDLPPSGKPIERDSNGHLMKPRSREHIEAWRDKREQGVAFVGNVFAGQINPDYLSDEAERIIEDILEAYCIDRDLLLNMVTLKNGCYYLYAHSFNVAVLSIHIAAALQYSRQQVMQIGVAGLLHDIGMRMVPKDLVGQPRVLTPEERFDVEKHSMHALYLLDRMTHLPWSTRYIVYQNHERPSGEGYPKKRGKKLIHRFARITAVADTYDALTAPRPWRKPLPPYKAMEHLLRGVPKGEFDGDAVRGLLQYLSLFPVGSMVKLDTGKIAKVLHANTGNFHKPVIKIVLDSDGRPVENGDTIDLAEEGGCAIGGFANGFTVPMEVGF